MDDSLADDHPHIVDRSVVGEGEEIERLDRPRVWVLKSLRDRHSGELSTDLRVDIRLQAPESYEIAATPISFTYSRFRQRGVSGYRVHPTAGSGTGDCVAEPSGRMKNHGPKFPLASVGVRSLKNW